MAFMMKKKKYKFNVEVHLEELVEVALVNEVLFAKIRLLDGGSFVEYSTREEVKNHTVKWNQKFEILCKMSANASTGVLDPCSLRISIRKEMKGGRSYYKLGFIDINLSEYAGSGEISRRFLLEGYDHRHRLDNSMLLVSLKMHMLSGDILFKAPSPASKERTKDGVVVNNEDGKTPQEDSPLEGVSPIISATGCPGAGTGSISISGGGGIGSRPISSSRDDIISQSQTSSGFGSLTKKKPDYFTSEIDPNALIASIVTDSGLSESSEPTIGSDSFPSYPPTSLTSLTSNAQQVVLPSCVGSGGIGGTGGSGGGGGSSGTGGGGGSGGGNISQVGVMEMGHSRNSSNTSQMSKGSGYSSFSHSQHSRQSSEGDSGHARFQKSLSLLSKLNQRAIHTAMKLNIPSLLNSNNNSNMMSIMINNCNNNDQNIKKMTTTSTITTPTLSTTTTATTIDNDGSVYLTPNSSLIVTEQNSEEFCTPLNETPNRIIDQLTLPSPLRRSRKIHNDDVVDDSEDIDVIDGLDDTSLHSPRIPKMKSLEDLNVLDIQFQRATIKQRLLNHQQMQQQQQQHHTQQLDLQQQQHHHHQPLSLLNHPMIEKLQNYELYNAAVTGAPGKIRSLNNLVFDNVDIEREQRVAELRKEFENLKNDTTQFKKPSTISSSSSSYRSSSKTNGKFNNNNRNKIGITKFIGDDDTESRYNHYPITKIKSMGTIPDIITDPIRYEPFLTPITNRKNTLSLGGDINEISDNNKKFKLNRMSSAESDEGSSSEIESYDYPTFNLIRSKPSSSSSSISYDRGFRSRYDCPERSSSGTNFTRNSLGCRNVNSNCIKNVNYGSICGGGGGGVCNGAGVGVRQLDGIIYYNDGRTRSISTNVQEIMRNPSSGSLVISETGSLDRMKTAAEKRKKGGVSALDDTPTVSDRVEETRVNPDSLIDEILKDTKLDQLKETTEPSGLQLYIARDGTASLGSHRVKSHVTAGAIKQVVMENPR